MIAVARRVMLALRTWPDCAAWRRSGRELLWGLPLLAAVAIVGGLVHLAPIADAATVLPTLALLFFVPALGEELAFRAALLPSPPGTGRPLRILAAIALFVLWHPFQAVTIGPPWSALFLDPWFLAATAVLGTLLTRLYLATGSIWPAVLTHWAVVAAWKLLLGGPFG